MTNNIKTELKYVIMTYTLPNRNFYEKMAEGCTFTR